MAFLNLGLIGSKILRTVRHITMRDGRLRERSHRWYLRMGRNDFVDLKRRKHKHRTARTFAHMFGFASLMASSFQIKSFLLFDTRHMQHIFRR